MATGSSFASRRVTTFGWDKRTPHAASFRVQIMVASCIDSVVVLIWVCAATQCPSTSIRSAVGVEDVGVGVNLGFSSFAFGFLGS